MTKTGQNAIPSEEDGPRSTQKKRGGHVRVVIGARISLNLGDLGSGTAMALRARFTHDNPLFHKKRAMGLWLGDTEEKIKSWEVEEGWLHLPRGARPDVEKFLQGRKLTMGPVFDRTVAPGGVDFKLCNGKRLRPYQIKAMSALIRTGNAIIRGPCGSGKTILLLGALVALEQPTIIIVHSGELMRQWRSVVADWLGIQAGTIGGGKGETIKNVTIAMQQTVRNREGAKWLDYFGCVVADEAHRWAASTFNFVANMFPARYRIAASADERRKDAKHVLIYETFGPMAHKITKEELLELDRLVPIRMEAVPTEFEDEEYVASRDADEMPDWGGMIGRMVEDADRNEVILEKVLSIVEDDSARILILSERVQACFDWYARLNAAGVPVGVMVGGQENKPEMERTVDGLRCGDVRVGVGTKVADEGLDIPALTHVVLTCPVHSHPKRLEQMIGRAARKHGCKTEGVAVYFWDRRMFPAHDECVGSKAHTRKEKKFLNRLKKVCSGLEIV